MLTDWRGNEYGIGDHILYAGSVGSSSAFMKEAEVISIVRCEKGYSTPEGVRIVVRPFRATKSYGTLSGRKVTLTRTATITKVS